MPIDPAKLSREVRGWARTHPRMQRLEAALAKLYGGHPPTGGPNVTALADRILLLLLGDRHGRVEQLLREMDDNLDRLLDDIEARRTGTPLPGRTPEQSRADMLALRKILEEIDRFKGELRTVLAEGTPESRVADLRKELLAELTPIGPRPGTAPGRAADLEEATGELRAALRGLPEPKSVRPDRPPTARELLQLPDEALRAASTLIRLLGEDPGLGPIPRTVQHLIRSAPPAELDRLVYAVLQASKVLLPGKRAPSSDWGRHQVAVTGTPAEWTGALKNPVRGDYTIGIDGIKDGWVVDAKLTSQHVEESGHIFGEVALPRREREIQPGVRPDLPREQGELGERELVEQIQGTAERPTISGEVLAERRFRIKTLSEIERQIQFAKENGLRGVRWVATTKEVADFFEQAFDATLRKWANQEPAVEIHVTWTRG